MVIVLQLKSGYHGVAMVSVRRKSGYQDEKRWVISSILYIFYNNFLNSFIVNVFSCDLMIPL